MKYKTLEEIQSIQVSDVIIELMARVLDISLVPLGEPFYNLLPDEGQSVYDRVQVHIALEKPSMNQLTVALEGYIDELIERFDVNAAENERVAALEARFAGLKDLRMAMERTGNQEPNAKLFKKRIIDNNDTDLLAILEADDALYRPEKEEDDQIEEEIELGKEAKSVCDQCLDLIRGHNKKNNITVAEINSMKTEFLPIYQVLVDGMPSEARVLINAAIKPAILPLKVKLQKVLTKRGF